MKKVQILDCTLRDGGRIIDCKFDDSTITNMSKDLILAGIDIVEIGFLRDSAIVKYNGNSTFFNDVAQMKKFIPKNRRNTKFVAFVDFEMYNFEELDTCDGTSVTGIRVGFTKNQFKNKYKQVVDVLLKVKNKGYDLYIQGVNSLEYTDYELKKLIDVVNEIHPYSFGIVDTYGAMFLEDMIHFYKVVNDNLNEDIAIDIHSHNNMQLSFAFAQEIIRISEGKRDIILDSTLEGMGKCAGNLNTELVVDYLIRKKCYNYDMDKILDAIDRYLVPLKNKNAWGYSIPSLMAGIYQAHPNNVIYLTENYKLNSKDYKYILSQIDKEKRYRYDYDNIHKVYNNYINDLENKDVYEDK